MNPSLYIGVLSGTSLDAVDVALVSFDDQKPRICRTLSYPITEHFKTRCLQFCQFGVGSIDEYGALDAEAGELFATAVQTLMKSANIDASQVCAIGSHGQTIRHAPKATPSFSLQIGDPNIITARTGICTIADFRRGDIALGGQGAPLAPAFHASVLGSPTENRVIVNIGGISNITLLSMDSNAPIIGFDTGPGNCLMDSWAQKHWNCPFDRDGSIASQGTIEMDLLHRCLNHPYFSTSPPKSTGRECFNSEWLEHCLNQLHPRKPSIENVQATLLALTVQSLSTAILKNSLENSAIYVCGGGVHNTFLMQSLQHRLARSIRSTASIGFDPDWIEAMLFAWLAKQTLECRPSNAPNATGAVQPTPLGGIYGYWYLPRNPNNGF